MTDRDVIERVTFIFGRAIQSIDKGPYKTEYATTIKGAPAASLMRMLRPLMGDKRQAAIDRALACFSPRETILSLDAAEEIRHRHRANQSKASLAREFGVSRHTIRSVITHRIYRRSPSERWMLLSRRIGSACAAGTRLSWRELYWLAGWLEGEGSFLAPHPSRPDSPGSAGSAPTRA